MEAGKRRFCVVRQQLSVSFFTLPPRRSTARPWLPTPHPCISPRAPRSTHPTCRRHWELAVRCDAARPMHAAAAALHAAALCRCFRANEFMHPTAASLPTLLPPCAGKFLGFLLRSIFLVNHDLNVIAASTVFITAGMSACTSAQAAVLSDW